jgi:glycine/D-amino acid oxidase-like deaminating enzyme
MTGADVLVVGAGCVGANVAYRLAERGAAVTLLDAGAPGAGTSGASFAWTNSFGKTPRDYHDLNVASMEEHAALTKELGGGGWLHQEGALAWEEGPAGLARLAQAVERLAGWGYPIERISPRQARELEPDLHIAPAVAQVVWTEGVTTADGARFEADWVVDCAGVAMDEIARLAGVAVPIDRVPGRLIYTAPVATTLRRPIHAPGCHFRPDGGGRIVLAEGAHDQVWAEAAPPWPPERSLAAVAAHLPALAGARVEATRIGVRPMPRDERPMVGGIPGLEGFYVVASHSGVTLGPLWGRVAAAELLDGALDPRLNPYRPTRFL